MPPTDVNQALKHWISGGEGGGGGVRQGRCERRSEVFVKIQKKKLFFFLGGGVG